MIKDDCTHPPAWFQVGSADEFCRSKVRNIVVVHDGPDHAKDIKRLRGRFHRRRKISKRTPPGSRRDYKSNVKQPVRKITVAMN